MLFTFSNYSFVFFTVIEKIVAKLTFSISNDYVMLLLKMFWQKNMDVLIDSKFSSLQN